MKQKQTRGCDTITWSHFSRRGWSAYASLGRQIRMGMLAASTLATVTPVQAEISRKESKAIENEEQTLEEVQVTGTMAPLTQLQSARIVSVLTREDIQQAGVQSTNDLLKLVSGVDVRQRGGFGIQTDISIDGGTFDQITILLNGVSVSNPQTGHYSANLPVSPEDIERIEILSGANSRVYGGAAFGGCINIITRREKENSIAAGAEGGMYGTVQGHARTSLTYGRVANRLSVGGGRSNGGTTNDDWWRAQAYYQGDYDRQALNLQWQLGFSKKGYGANTFYSAAYPNQYDRNENYTMSVSGETKGRFRLAPTVWWNRTYNNFELIRGERFGENFHRTDVYGLRLLGHIDWKAGKTAVGAEMHNEDILSTNLGRPLENAEYVGAHGQRDIFYDHHDNRTDISFNAEHNLTLSHWTISAGLIANRNTSVGHKFRLYPGVDIAYRPATNWKFYASYNKGFRLPTFTDLYYKSPTLSGNTDLRPEVNRSMQVGAQYSRPGLHTTLRAFYHRGHNMIDWVMYTPTDIYHSASFNLDNMGVQADMKIDFARLLKKEIFIRSFSVGYTYINQKRHNPTEIYKSNYALEYLRHKLTATLHHGIAGHLTATWSLRWQDRMGGYIRYDANRAASGSEQLTPYSPYATLDLKLQWTEARWLVYVTGSNLTNCRYYDFGNIRQPGIWALAGARINFNL